MARHLFIVSPERMDFFAELRDRFADDPHVRVIVDRRCSKRAGSPPRADRRVQREADEDLRTRGYAIVTLP